MLLKVLGVFRCDLLDRLWQGIKIILQLINCSSYQLHPVSEKVVFVCASPRLVAMSMGWMVSEKSMSEQESAQMQRWVERRRAGRSSTTTTTNRLLTKLNTTDRKRGNSSQTKTLY